MARGSGYCYKNVLPFSALVAMECNNVALNTLFKFATNHGMSHHVFIVYAYGVAALLLFPAMILCSCRSRAPPLNFSVMIKVFLLGVVGCTSSNMGYTGIKYASPTLASAISNLTPAFTFVLALIFRMEKLALSSRSSRAKVVGTLISISGAFVVALLKGPSINSSPTKHQLIHSSQSTNWIIGSLFLTVEYILIPVWYIMLTHIMREYPAELTLMFFYNLVVSILAALVGLIVEPDSSKWMIRPNVALASIICSGVFGSCLNNVIHSWALHLRGPLYVAMFKPLSIAIAAAMGVVVLGDTLYLGSIIGAMIIAMGFYTVMWGKTKEDLSEFDEISDLESVDTHKHPLLQSYKTAGTENG